MKKILILVLLLTSTVIFLNCAAEEADLNFKNSYGATVDDISWKDSDGNQNETWGGSLSDGSTNAFKTVTAMDGTAEAFEGGQPKELEWKSGQSYMQLDDGGSHTYDFNNAVTAKK